MFIVNKIRNLANTFSTFHPRAAHHSFDIKLTKFPVKNSLISPPPPCGKYHKSPLNRKMYTIRLQRSRD